MHLLKSVLTSTMNMLFDKLLYAKQLRIIQSDQRNYLGSALFCKVVSYAVPQLFKKDNYAVWRNLAKYVVNLRYIFANYAVNKVI